MTDADREANAREWRCFHCGDVFNDERSARLHFGRDETSEAACVIKAGAEGSLLKALRNAEEQADDAMQRMHEESTDAAKAYHAQRCRHTQALMAAEELGYERGLSDASTQPSQAIPDGWVVVPVEPTEAMLDQGVAALESAEFVPPTTVWAKMLAAAPKPTAAQEQFAENAKNPDEGTALTEALRASLAKRSQPTMDPPYTAAFNAALDMVARDVAPFLLAAPKPAAAQEQFAENAKKSAQQVRQALLMARSWMRGHSATCSSFAIPECQDGPYLDCDCDYPDRCKVIDDAFAIAGGVQDTAMVGATPVEATDTELLDAIRENCWDLRCFDRPTGGGDADVGWSVVGHWMAEPTERTIAISYSDEPRDAIRSALAAPHPIARADDGEGRK